MDDRESNHIPLIDRSGVTDSVRAQILATEHWSLLATRSMTWNEVFSRAGMYVTLLSAAVVGLALVAQAVGFGAGFRLFALLVLPVVLLMGMATVLRLGEANKEDLGLIIGMNRLRHAYLELAPELEPYFTTGHHDDMASVMQSLGMGHRMSFIRVLGSTPSIVGSINAVVAGVIAAMTAQALGAVETVQVLSGVLVALATAAAHGVMAFYSIRQGRLRHHSRFPSG